MTQPQDACTSVSRCLSFHRKHPHSSARCLVPGRMSAEFSREPLAQGLVCARLLEGTKRGSRDPGRSVREATGEAPGRRPEGNNCLDDSTKRVSLLQNLGWATQAPPTRLQARRSAAVCRTQRIEAGTRDGTHASCPNDILEGNV